MHKRGAILILALFPFLVLNAQEKLIELSSNSVIENLHKFHKPKRTKNTVIATLPFIDDFSNYTGYPDENLWQDNSTFVNQMYSFFPPSTGVLTFDALDASGKLYQTASVQTFPADTLTSQYIRLDSIFNPNPKKLEIADSIYLSFYFQPGGGTGNMWERSGLTPSYNDSLIVEFYNPADTVWELVWSQYGIPVDSVIQETGWHFKYVLIPILKEEYLSNQFQFRFRNFCSLENTNYRPGYLGNCDQWHIDYVRLNSNRNYQDTSYDDITFSVFAPSFLKRYQAMPTIQFRDDELKDSLNMYIANLDAATQISQYTYGIFDTNNIRLGGWDGGLDNIDPYFPSHEYQTASAHRKPPVKYSFPFMDQGKNSYIIKHVIKKGVGVDLRQQNDTLSFEQIFWNYYAYDDGSAENGYGVVTTTGIAKTAYKFSLNVQDTLTSIDIYFNNTLNEGNNIPFRLVVWSDKNGEPGTIIYQGKEVLYPKFNGINTYARYVLEKELLVKGTIYIGIDQGTPNFINIGFDRNNDASENIFYTNDNISWKQPVHKGALMIRPCFGWEGTIVGIQKPQIEEVQFTIYPNPAKDILTINYNNTSTQTQDSYIKISNMLGQVVFEREMNKNINISQLKNGIYILVLIDRKTKKQYSHRLIISH